MIGDAGGGGGGGGWYGVAWIEPLPHCAHVEEKAAHVTGDRHAVQWSVWKQGKVNMSILHHQAHLSKGIDMCYMFELWVLTNKCNVEKIGDCIWGHTSLPTDRASSVLIRLASDIDGVIGAPSLLRLRLLSWQCLHCKLLLVLFLMTSPHLLHF